MNDQDRLEWAKAAQEGRKKFKMSEPCRNGHLGFRYTNGNGACVACQKEYYARRSAAAIRIHRIVLDLVDPAHAPLVRQYTQTLNDFARSQKNGNI